MRIYAHDFDRDLLSSTTTFRYPLFSAAALISSAWAGFDPAFDLFEDWDFLIRLAQRGDFIRVPRITCEVRHIKGADSIVLSSPEGSPAFRRAKLQVWRKHGVDNDLFANVFESEKRRAITLEGNLVEARGAHNRLEQEVARLDRDKHSLIAQISALNERLNETLMRNSHLEGANAEIRGALDGANRERYAAVARIQQLETALDADLAELQRTNGALQGEVVRLQNLLDTIFQSRTWKLHTIVERVKGRG